MKKYLLAILAISLCGFLFTVPAIAENNSLNYIISADNYNSGPHSDLIEKKIKDLSTELNLSDIQKEQAAHIAKESAKKNNIYAVQFIQEKNKLIAMKKAGKPIQQIQAQVRLIQSIKSRINIARKKNMKEFEAILTEEQQEVFNKFKAELNQLKQTENRFVRQRYQPKSRDEAIESLKNVEE